ncbi:hypothetical protein G293_00135 [Candidatus Liberibacter africanus PTSAPSY]|uniref:Outer membrane protein beta-barrel domain-containing protein n=2 Tax=Liberibacter africanus TaxID=34020 RepID=A0A0G3I1E3_LIBAF|nr:hypothetical protein G293_00135 [Candidatus Liberibacter africanus PTSAPSY]
MGFVSKKFVSSPINTLLCSGLFLGFMSSTVMADNYYYPGPSRAEFSNSNFSRFQGLYIGSDFVKNDSNASFNFRNLVMRNISVGYDGQDGSLVYGLSSNLEGNFLNKDTDLNNLSATFLLRTGFTFDNSNSTIFQNTLVYGFGGFRVKDISNVKNIRGFIPRPTSDTVLGVGIEKKIASMFSVRAEYSFSSPYNQLQYSSWKNVGVSTGVVVRF